VAQEYKPLANSGVVACGNPLPSSQMSTWVKSGNGSAAVEVRQRITGSGNRRVCRTTWILHVRKESEQPHATEVAEIDASPADGEWNQENSFEIDAWSTDSHLLLAAQSEAAGDAEIMTPIIYDFNIGSYRRLELGPVFGQMTPANCYVVYYPLSFDDSGNLVISAMSTDTDREPGTPASFPERLWRFDLRTNTISRMRPQRPKSGPEAPAPPIKPSPPSKPRN
jgi:hypothetical protein